MILLLAACGTAADTSAKPVADTDDDSGQLVDTDDTQTPVDTSLPPGSACPLQMPLDYAGATRSYTWYDGTSVDESDAGVTSWNDVPVLDLYSTRYDGGLDEVHRYYSCDPSGAHLMGRDEVYTVDGVSESWHVEYDPAEAIWPAELEVGTTWNVEGTGSRTHTATDGTEEDLGTFTEPEEFSVTTRDVSITVGAGTYTTWTIQHSGTSDDVVFDNTESWADGVGLVYAEDTSGILEEMTTCTGLPGC